MPPVPIARPLAVTYLSGEVAFASDVLGWESLDWLRCRISEATGFPKQSLRLTAEGRVISDSGTTPLSMLFDPGAVVWRLQLLRLPSALSPDGSCVATLTSREGSGEALLAFYGIEPGFDGDKTIVEVEVPEAANGVYDLDFSPTHYFLRFRTPEGRYFFDLERRETHLDADGEQPDGPEAQADRW